MTTRIKVPHQLAFEHDEVGFNYRIPNLNAALGIVQREQLPLILEDKRIIAQDYAKQFVLHESTGY